MPVLSAPPSLEAWAGHLRGKLDLLSLPLERPRLHTPAGRGRDGQWQNRCSRRCWASGEEGKPLELLGQRWPQKRLSPLESEEMARACSLVNLLKSRMADVKVGPGSAESPAEALRSASRQRKQDAHVGRARSGFSLAGPATPLCKDSVASGASGGRILGAPVGAWGAGNPGICSSLQQYCRVTARGKTQRTPSGSGPCSCPSKTKPR